MAYRPAQPPASRSPPRRSDEAGIALLAVLWILLLLALIALAMTTETRNGSRIVRNIAARAQAHADADAALHRALFDLHRPPGPDRWFRDGTPYRVPLAGRELDVAIQDEAGKIDLNAAPDALIAAALAQNGLMLNQPQAMGLVRQLRDRPMLPTSATARSCTLRGKPVRDLRDLAKLLPTAPEPAQLRTIFTTASGQGTLDPLLASRPALASLPGVQPQVLDRVMAVRQQAPLSAVIQSVRSIYGGFTSNSTERAYSILTSASGSEMAVVVCRR